MSILMQIIFFSKNLESNKRTLDNVLVIIIDEKDDANSFWLYKI